MSDGAAEREGSSPRRACGNESRCRLRATKPHPATPGWTQRTPTEPRLLPSAPPPPPGPAHRQPSTARRGRPRPARRAHRAQPGRGKGGDGTHPAAFSASRPGAEPGAATPEPRQRPTPPCPGSPARVPPEASAQARPAAPHGPPGPAHGAAPPYPAALQGTSGRGTAHTTLRQRAVRGLNAPVGNGGGAEGSAGRGAAAKRRRTAAAYPRSRCGAGAVPSGAPAPST